MVGTGLRQLLLGGVCAMAAASAAAAQAPQPSTAGDVSQNNPAPGKLTDQASNQSADVSEVVVTAQKRVERVQDVPVPITVVGGDQLARQNIQTVGDLGKAAPSLEFQTVPGQGGGPAVRGIGTEAVSVTAENSVALVLDGVVLGRQPLNDLFDVARVEVLRGPQGMLFGKNASAGVINITTNAPNPDRFEAIAHIDQGFELGYGVYQGIVNLPLADHMALRVSGHVNTESGIVHDVALRQDGGSDDKGVRARFLWEPTPDLTINVIADYDHQLVDDEFLQFDYLGPTAAGLRNVLAACGVTPSRGNRDICQNKPTYFTNSTYGVSGQIDYRIGGYTITSITAERQNPNNQGQDVDVTPVDLLYNHENNYSATTSEEIRVASPQHQFVEFVAGFYYADTTVKQDQAGIGTAPLIAFGPVVIVPPIDQVALSHGDLTTYAGFGQATVHLGSRLRLIAGARETHDEVSVDSLDRVANTFQASERDENNFSYRVGAQYDFARTLMVYGTYSRGYKGPQVNLPQPGLPANLVNAEIPIAYELGVKGSLFGDRLAVDLNGFYTTVHDYQTQILVNSPTGPTFIIGNVPFVRTRGVELDVFGRPLRGLTVNAGLTYDRATYGPFAAQDISLNTVDVSGGQIAFAPEWKATFSGEYSRPVTSWLNAFVQSDLVYRSSINFNAVREPQTTLGDTVQLGARAGVRAADGRWSVSVFARNLLDQRNPANLQVGPLENFSGGLSGGVPSVAHVLTLDSFRLVGVTLDARF